MRKKIMIIFVFMLLFANIPNVEAAEILSEMPNGSYIIGKTLYTRSPFEDYNGVLKTEFIMKASKTISDDELDSMIIYYKSPRGILMNALTGETVDVYESDLMEDVEYYNGVKIPSLTLKASAINFHEGETNYLISLSDDLLAEGGNTKSWIQYDLYGAKDWNGVIYNFPSSVTPSEPSNEDLTLISSNLGIYGYSTSFDNGTCYSYVAYPYIKNGDDKLYLSTVSTTLYAGAKSVLTIVDNQVKLTVSGINNYKIARATLYASRSGSKTTPHIENKDIINIIKGNGEYINSLSNNFYKFMNVIAKQKSCLWGSVGNSYNWYIADIYMTFDLESAKSSITLGDLGNSEKETNYYRADLTISSPDILNGREINISGNSIEGIVYQTPIDSYTGENEMYLLPYVRLLSALADEYADGDIDLGDDIGNLLN